MSKNSPKLKKQDVFRESKRLKPTGITPQKSKIIDTSSWIIILVLFSLIISILLLGIHVTPVISHWLSSHDSIKGVETIPQETEENLPSSNPQNASSNDDLEESSTTLETLPSNDSEEVPVSATKEDDDIQQENQISPEILELASRIPQVMYLHFGENSKARNFSWVPQLSEQKISENDVAIDLSNFLDSSLSYELTDYQRHLVDLVVHYEANGEPFLGQVLVAEDVLNRIRSGVYGTDIVAILAQGYEGKIDANGGFHLYYGSKEILEASESVQEAVQLALHGSNISYFLLKAVTDFRNEQFDLTLDDTYYQYGAMYHYDPNVIAKSEIKSRNINRVPVSFHYGGHIFYGHWLSRKQALSIS